jgi:S-adenosylmethionine hydrolase
VDEKSFQKTFLPKKYTRFMNNLITLTTDFGLGEYTAAMKGVILKINPDAKIIDIMHMIRAQNIKEGAYVLYSTSPYFPKAIHVGVVDPGVGTERKAIIIECERGTLVGPDNGLLVPCARRLGIKSVYEITNKDYLNEPISDTFHGRDIFAPVAGHISKGVPVTEMGVSISDFVDLKLEEFEEGDGFIKGKFLFLDRFGNLIFSIPRYILLKHLNFGDEIEITIQNQIERLTKRIRFLPSYAHGEPKALLATISSSDFLEIACNSESAIGYLKMAPISEIIVKF